MKLFPVSVSALRPTRLAVLALVAGLSGCSFLGDSLFAGDKVDYRTTKTNTKPLDVPPDLSQLSRDARYQPQGGVISATGVAAPASGAAASPAASAPALVALASQGDVRVERAGQQRWLVVDQTPEQLWPLLKTFWEQRGFVLDEEDAKVGVMETNWAENRAKLPADAVRNTIGRVLGNLYDTGERDRFRTRVERTAAGSEIYISHRGVEEIFANERRESTVWRGRPNDPQLEAEMLSRLMVALGTPEAGAQSALAAATPAAAASAAARPGAATVAGTATSLTLNETFDRAWRRVGLALDRSGFTVEDRDRSAGLYYVRYVDPRNVGKEEPGFWSRLFGNTDNPLAAQRYRVVVKTTADTSDVSVQTSAGVVETGENARRIIALLGNELR